MNQRDIILLSYPFSDLLGKKVRPAIIISNDEYNKKFEDIVAVPLTTNLKLRDYAFLLTNKDLESGRLIKDSNVKVDRIFSVEKKLVRLVIGKVKKDIHKKIIEILMSIVK